MPNLYVLRCNNPICLHHTLLPPLYLAGISPHQEQLPKETIPLNFVCPDCGNGYPYYLDDLHEQEFSYNPYELPDGQSLFDVSLKCEKASCAAHARVHTLAATGSSSTRPALALSEWKLHDIMCSDGHLVKVPLEQLTNPFDSGESGREQ